MAESRTATGNGLVQRMGIPLLAQLANPTSIQGRNYPFADGELPVV